MQNNNNLVPFTSNGMEFFINRSNGESFASQSAVARMCEVSETAIRKWITSNQIDVIIAEISTATGLKTANLLSESSIYEALAKYKPTLLVACARAGLRVYLHKLAGFEFSSTATKPKTALGSAFATIEEHLSNINQRFSEHEYALADLQDSIEMLMFREAITPPVFEMLVNLPIEPISPVLSKEEQLTKAFTEVMEIRDRWCEEVGIPSITNGDNAFAEAVRNGKVPEIDRLLPIVKWGTSNGISRGSLTRIRKRLANNTEIRSLDRPKATIIGSNSELEIWVRDQRSAFPREAVAGLHRRMQLQHPEISVSITTLSRWLESEGLG